MARLRVTYLGFFPPMLLLGGGGFLMAYTGAVSLVYLYVYNSLTTLGFVIAYLHVFGRGEVSDSWVYGLLRRGWKQLQSRSASG